MNTHINNRIIAITVEIPSIRDNTVGFYKLWNILFTLNLNKKDQYYIRINFNKCNYVGFNLTGLLGAFIHTIKKEYTCTIKVETKTMNDQVYIKLKNIGLLSTLLKTWEWEDGFRPTADIIPYREFRVTDTESDVIKYLKDEWLGKNRLNLSDDVESSVLSSLWEVYANAFEHSNSSTVFCCGSYDRKEQTLTLLVGDTGQGIVKSINNYLSEVKSPQEALKWALVRGNSTYTSNIETKSPRGLGLAILSRLVDANNGILEIYTDEVSYKRESKQKEFKRRDVRVKGCWVKLKLHCNKDIIYCFSDEIPKYF